MGCQQSTQNRQNQEIKQLSIQPPKIQNISQEQMQKQKNNMHNNYSTDIEKEQKHVINKIPYLEVNLQIRKKPASINSVNKNNNIANQYSTSSSSTKTPAKTSKNQVDNCKTGYQNSLIRQCNNSLITSSSNLQNSDQMQKNTQNKLKTINKKTSIQNSQNDTSILSFPDIIDDDFISQDNQDIQTNNNQQKSYRQFQSLQQLSQATNQSQNKQYNIKSYHNIPQQQKQQKQQQQYIYKNSNPQNFIYKQIDQNNIETQKFAHYNNIQPIDVYKKVSPELTNLILKNNKYKNKKNISKLKKSLKNKNQAQIKSIIQKINSQIQIEKIDEDFIIAREQYRKKENLEAVPVPLLSENFQQALIIKKREKLQQIMLKQ